MASIDLARYKSQVVNIVIIVLFVFISSNIYKSASKNITALSDKRDEESKKNKVLEDISLEENKVTDLKSFINTKDINLVITTINDIAKESGLKVASIRPGAPQDVGLYTKYPFAMVLDAPNYNTVGVFLSKLESHPDIYIVESVDIAPTIDPQTNSVSKVAATLRVTTITIKDK